MPKEFKPSARGASWSETIQEAVTSGHSAVYAMRINGPDMRAAAIAQITAAGLRSVLLRPPHRWSPLAPMRQLCDLWQRSWPALDNSDDAIPLLWLGLPVLRGQQFAAIAMQLQGCPTVAWLTPEALRSPVLGDFLRAASQGELAMPVTFVCQIPPGDPVPSAGITQVLQYAPPATSADVISQSSPIAQTTPAIAKRTAGYLSQALFFGDALNDETKTAMKAVSRADHAKHQDALRAAGVLREDGSFALESLQDIPLPPTPQSKRWRRRALAHISPDDHEKRLWLQLAHAPPLAPKDTMTSAAFIQGLLSPGPRELAPGLQAASALLDPSLHAMAALALQQTPDDANTALAQARSEALTPPYIWLHKARTLPMTGIQGCHALRGLHQQAQAAGATTVAALIALDLVRWHQALGQETQTFALLAPYQDEPHWAIQWQRWCLLAEAYHRMARQDMARHALEQAAAVAPKPLSPVLAAELRLFTAKMHAPSFADTDPSHPETQLSAAKRTFRAMGDGRRLATYFLLLAERQQQKKQLDEARALLAQALQLSRQYRDGIGAQIAEIKLGLLRQQQKQSMGAQIAF